MHDTVEITEVERDERVDELQRRLTSAIRSERGYLELSESERSGVDAVLTSLEKMRFEDRSSLARIASLLLTAIAPGLEPYVQIAIDAAARQMATTKGVLVIYTGGTIGSAPKDPDDPDSPQIVKPWAELKNAAPQLGLLGYPVDAVSFEEPLDSCNVGPAHWRTMCKIIEDHHDEYAGFVVLHGTDTMSFTASALSFLLRNLDKTVVVTGSQVAGIVNARNDAHQNMITAVTLANPEANGLPPINEVVIAFGNIVIRGNRSRKMKVESFQGFDSPNHPPLGVAGESIDLDRKQLLPRPSGTFAPAPDLDTNVIMVEVFPGIQASPVLGRLLEDDELRGVVVKAYGAGNIPTDAAFLSLFEAFVARGGVVVVVTSVAEGAVVMGMYETSQLLADRGLLGGFDMTPEAALSKLMWLLAQYPDDPPTVRRLMQRSIVGEQSLSVFTTGLSGATSVAGDDESAEVIADDLHSVEEKERIERVTIRFTDAEISPGANDVAVITLRGDDGAILGEFRRGQVPERVLETGDVGESVVLDLSAHRSQYTRAAESARDRDLRSRQGRGFRLSIAPADASFRWSSAELAIFASDT